VTSGRIQTQNRRSQQGWDGSFDTNFNFADVFPPAGFENHHLMGFHAGIGRIFFDGTVDDNDILWVRWNFFGNHIRIVCNNSENREASTVSFIGIWRK